LTEDRFPHVEQATLMTDPVDQLYERVLILRCQAGDAAAFAELVGLHNARLWYYLRKMWGEVHGAEDLLQDIWFDVFRGLSRLADPAAFRAWLYRIARIRVFRALRNRHQPCLPLVETDLIDEPADDEDFSAEDAARIHLALNQLAVEHREVVVLRFLEEMSYEEIARVVECPVGTVRSRLYYAKCALRRALERTMDHERERVESGLAAVRSPGACDRPGA
jgi:RNA polymerase sigma-70 factor (ECF subfamily)